MTDTFTWPVHASAAGGSDFNLAQVDFGDGYSQVAALGLNPEKNKWDVTISGFRDDLIGVGKPLTFIRDHIGQSFYWTPPLGDEGYYICKGVRPKDEGSGYFTLNMTFEETFAP